MDPSEKAQETSDHEENLLIFLKLLGPLQLQRGFPGTCLGQQGVASPHVLS